MHYQIKTITIKINRKGVTRIVLEFKSVVIKIPNFTCQWSHFLKGIIGNIEESRTWKWNSGKFEKGTSHLLCPVKWCSVGGWILIMEAVLSGTLSFIFNTYKGDLKFSDVVLDAKEKGYTEPDPRDDLSGLDVARKALILSRDSGAQMELTDIIVENLVPENLREVDVKTFLERLPEVDAAYESIKNEAESKGNVLRYMAVIENGTAKIELKQVDNKHPFYNLSGSDNMIVFTTERYKNNPLVIKGPGAGAEVTAAGVFAEIISIGNYMAN